MLLLTLISLYTVRITLQALGVEDYGIYNVIGSVVGSLSILTGAMASASQRFLSFHLGKKDHQAYSRTFTMLLLGFIILALALYIVGQVLGFFFLDGWLNIPADRMYAAKWVYQTSLLAFCCTLITVPYSSSIIANEKMGAFALFSIVEGVVRLGIVFLLMIYGGDRLILYGILTFGASVVVLLMNITYCHSKIKFCRYIWKWDKQLFKELTTYTGWNLFGSTSAILMTQGQSILLNIFFGPVVNAAKAIADKIYHVVLSFSTNLYMAISPQIIKSYAANDLQRTQNLVLKSSRITFMLLFVISFPLICEMQGILQIWLGDDAKTPYMSTFSQLMLIYCMVNSLEQPITRFIQATGVINKYQICVGSLTLAYLPICLGILYLGVTPITTVIVMIVVMAFAQGIRIVIAHNQVRLDYRLYVIEVVLPIFRISICAVILYLVLTKLYVPSHLFEVIMKFIADLLAGMIAVWLIGMKKVDREFVLRNIKKRISQKK